MTLYEDLIQEKSGLESYLDNSGKGLPQNQLERLNVINSLLSTTNTIDSTDVSELAKESGGNLDNIFNDVQNVVSNFETLNSCFGQQSSNIPNLDDILYDSTTQANLMGLLKSLALNNRQISQNTKPWEILTLSVDSITVPVGSTYHLLFGNIKVITSSDSGNRRVEITVLDENSNVLYILPSENVQAENLEFNYPLSLNNYTANVDTNTYPIQMPNSIILSQGQTFSVKLLRDFSNSDAFSVYMQVGVR